MFESIYVTSSEVNYFWPIVKENVFN